ncbi:MAG: hypothetical protein JWQ90_5515 [Hydrocarboniphaga sp.]|uniref:hypothetical protein n=1 Tax=Hydrocarboniphaga sp. TaxID=2033016 RepID=UPI00263902DA|nr:hypothetical protein [Hydrocarboniphaga sp.]MDB5973065.1 hypothetical protein [Hydrocarboniphaga sp.]
MKHAIARSTPGLIAMAASLLLIGTAQAGSLKVIDYSLPSATEAAAAAPDLNGDGRPDYFEIRIESTVGGIEDRLHAAALQPAANKPASSSSQTCVYLAISEGGERWSHDRAYCGNWRVSALNVPDRVTPKDQLPYVAHLSPKLLIPKFGYVASARDAVFVQANGKPSFLFFDGVDYVLHTGMDAHEVVSVEAMEMLARFEQPRGGSSQASAVSAP